MEFFQYKPIDLQGRSFRLVRILKGEDGPVKCDLFDAWLDDEERLEYEALSYTWGDESSTWTKKSTHSGIARKTHETEVNGKVMLITKNLSMALRNLRYSHQDRTIWIDAICIDQTKHKERGHQVLQMALIYKKAEQVVIWLGPATTVTDIYFDCMSKVEKAAVSHACRGWRVSDERWLAIWQTVLSTKGTTWDSLHQQRLGLTQLLERRWFARSWIIQKVANARAAQVACGTKSVSARIFALSPVLLSKEPSQHCQAILDIMPGPTRNYSWWAIFHDLYTLLLKFKESEASDPRHNIYALLSISSDRANTDALQPDYGKCEGEVVRDTIKFILELSDEDECPPAWTLPQFLEKLERLGNEVLNWAAGQGIMSTVESLLGSGKARVDFRDGSGQIPLLFAMENGHTNVVDLLIEKNQAHVNGHDPKSQTQQLLATEIRNPTTTKQLFATNKAYSYIMNSQGETPLILAAAHGHDRAVKALLKTGKVDPNYQTGVGETPLHVAAEHGHESVARLLLQDSNIAVNTTDFKGQTPLLLAARVGHTAIVNELLNTGVDDGNVKDDSGWLPLWLGAINGHRTIVDLLYDCRRTKANKTCPPDLIHGQEMLVKHMFGISGGHENFTGGHPVHPPLLWAAKNGFLTVVRLLFREGDASVQQLVQGDGKRVAWLAHPGAESELKCLLWMIKRRLYETERQIWATGLVVLASSKGRFTLAKVLLDLEMSDTPGEGQALWNASSQGHESIVRLVLDTGRTNVNFEKYHLSDLPSQESTSLWQAASNGHTAIVKLLLGDPNIEINSKAKSDRRTPLAIAAMHGNLAVVELVLGAGGVDVNSRDRDWRTPLDLARWRKHEKVVQVLEAYLEKQHDPISEALLTTSRHDLD